MTKMCILHLCNCTLPALTPVTLLILVFVKRNKYPTERGKVFYKRNHCAVQCPLDFLFMRHHAGSKWLLLLIIQRSFAKKAQLKKIDMTAILASHSMDQFIYGSQGRCKCVQKGHPTTHIHLRGHNSVTRSHIFWFHINGGIILSRKTVFNLQLYKL